jgi:hypothetical protein
MFSAMDCSKISSKSDSQKRRSHSVLIASCSPTRQGRGRDGTSRLLSC